MPLFSSTYFLSLHTNKFNFNFILFTDIKYLNVYLITFYLTKEQLLVRFLHRLSYSLSAVTVKVMRYNYSTVSARIKLLYVKMI